MANTLVSVIVVVYNSSQFVVETLESVSNQTWREIELIITDDCSDDDTVEVCNNWLKKNNNKYLISKIITSEKNTGIPANVNRGLNVAKGDWIMLLAGDDTLKPDCIKENMLWITARPSVNILFSRINVYKDTFEPQNFLETIPGDPFNPDSILFHNRSADSQYKMLLLTDRIHFTPSAFLNRKTIQTVGGFDERFKMLEDYPMWLKLTKNGFKLFFMDKITVNYRQHLKASNNTGLHHLINPNYYTIENFRRIYTYPYLPVDIRLNQRFIWYVSQIFRQKWLNKNNKCSRFLYNVFILYLNPFNHYIQIKKHLRKDLKTNEFYM
jgi:glycosyltransferase involved in cell wall biosynthesis